MALMEILVRLVCLVTVVNLEKMVYLVLLVLWVKKVLQVVLVLLVCLDTRVHLENKAILDCLVLKDLVEDQDQLALSVQLGNQELEVDVVLQEKQVNLVSLVELVLKVQEEEMDPRALLEKLDLPVNKVFPVLLVNLVLLVLQVPQVLPAKAR